MKKIIYLLFNPFICLLFLIISLSPSNFSQNILEKEEISFSNPLSLENIEKSRLNILVENDHIINGKKEKGDDIEDIFLNNEASNFSLVTKEKYKNWGIFIKKNNFSGHGTYKNGEIDYSKKYENVQLIYNQKVTSPLKVGLGLGMSSIYPWEYSAGLGYDFKFVGLLASLILNSSKTIYPAILDLSYKSEFRRFLIREASFDRGWGLESKLTPHSSLFLKQSFSQISPFEQNNEINQGKPCQITLSDGSDIKSVGINYFPKDNLNFMLSHSQGNHSIEMKLKENKRSFGYLQGSGRELDYQGKITILNKKNSFSLLYNINRWISSGSARLESWPFTDDLSGLLSEDRAYDYSARIKSQLWQIESKKIWSQIYLITGIDYVIINNLDNEIKEWQSLFFGMIQNLLDEHILQVEKVEMFVPCIKLGYRLKKWDISYRIKQYLPWKIKKKEEKEEKFESETESIKEKYKGGDFHQISLSYYF